jgi:dipeptidyl aminopeptidase/acylaminoacyl peptidase
MKKFLLPIFCLSLSLHVFSQQRKPLHPQDLYQIPVLNDPEVSPDGKWISYTLSEPDTSKDKKINKLWMQSWDGRESVELTHGPDGVNMARWSPDGRYISFLSARDSKNGAQLWLMDRRGGEGKKLTEIKGDINEYVWSPNGHKIVMSITQPENDGKPEPKTPKPIVIDRYHFKQDVEGYLQHRQTHLYIFDVDTKKLDTLTKGNKNESSPAWSPDGNKIAFVSNRSAEPDRNENNDIFVVDAVPNANAKQLTTWKGNDSNPKWSPDGKYISYLRSTADADFIMYDQTILALMDVDGSNNKLLTLSLDRPVADQVWSKDSKHIAFLVTDDRQRYVSEINLPSNKITVLAGGDKAFTSIKAQNADNWLVQMTDPQTPAELYTLEKGKLRRVTTHQQGWLSKVSLATVEGFTSRSKDGTKVSGLLFKPAGYTAGKLPLILFIHGGPVGQDGFGFDMTRQMLAGAGYAVAAVNYRGSNGRGLAYSKSIFADWGNKEVDDLLSAVDELVKQGIADPDNLGIGGWSYGGILTDYTIASDTRFKAACSGAGSGLQLSMYGIDQYVLQYENELGLPWKNSEKYLQLSYPFLHADRIKTPVLYMSGLKDFNVPTAGSEQMYQALRSLGVPTKLVVYPNQFHGIGVPSYQVDVLERYIGWYNTYLKKR